MAAKPLSHSTVHVASRVLRRVIKQHRRIPGLGLDVPHASSYAIATADLLGLASERELDCSAASLGPSVVLVPRDAARDEAGGAHSRTVREWRAAFHGSVHLELERRIARGELTIAAIRARIHAIGQAEFDEIRHVLRTDGLLLPPHDDAETYVEFVATYLELRSFAPHLVERIFPGLAEPIAMEPTLALDIDVAALAERTRPDGAPAQPALVTDRSRDSLESTNPAPRASRAPVRSDSRPARQRDAAQARAAGNCVRATLLFAAAGNEHEARACLAALVVRLRTALDGAPTDDDAWASALWPLVATATLRGSVARNPEARLLHDLQNACADSERDHFAVDPIEWVRSLGRRPVRRLLPEQGRLRALRHLRSARDKIRRLALDDEDRARLAGVSRRWIARAEHAVRTAFRPRIERTLERVGLRAQNVAEHVAREKLIDELSDLVVDRGFFSLGVLRDAISRNRLKLPALSAREFVTGDAALRTDRALADSLDGVYRRGEIYLRALHRISAMLFATRVGRALTLYALVPIVGAFVLLEGLQHVIGPLAVHVLGIEEPRLATRSAFAVTSVVIFALLHSARARAFASGTLRLAGGALRAAFVTAPRYLLARPAVRALLTSTPVRAARRYLVKPLAIAALGIPALVALRVSRVHIAWLVLLAGLVWNVVLNTRAGSRLEEATLDVTLRTWRNVRQRIVPGVIAAIGSVFRRMTDRLERWIYAVDEWLRFHSGERPWRVALKAALASAWFVVTYVIRLYLNLLMEPQVNPIKHFPVVTVAAKIILPLSPALIAASRAGLAPLLGNAIGGALAAVTVLSLPGFFGFLVWEFKENWKLYERNRHEHLEPVAIGHHGETLASYLRPGFHSGTIPRLHTRIRRATRRNDRVMYLHRRELRHVAETIQRLVEREFVALLSAEARWSPGVLVVTSVETTSNRIRITIACDATPDSPAVVSFEEQSGYLVAGVARTGWIAGLDAARTTAVENALVGLYKLADVDFVREQVSALLGDGVPYDFGDDGLVAWPGEGYRTEWRYALSARETLTATTHGASALDASAPVLRHADLAFARDAIRWDAWVACWQRAVEGTAIPRLAHGPRLLSGTTLP